MKRYVLALVLALSYSGCNRHEPQESDATAGAITLPTELQALAYPGAQVEEGLAWRDEEPEHTGSERGRAVISAELFTADGYDQVLDSYKHRTVDGMPLELNESTSVDGRSAHFEAESATATTLILISEDPERGGTIIQLVRGKSRPE